MIQVAKFTLITLIFVKNAKFIFILPSLFSFTVFFSNNLDLDIALNFLMNINEPIDLTSEAGTSNVPIDFTSGAGSSNITTGGNTGDQQWIDVQLELYKGKYYVVDEAQKNGTNLIANFEPASGQGKPELVSLKRHKGFLLGDANSIQLSDLEYQGQKYKGYYADFKFSNATLTSKNVPIQKNDKGSIFIAWKKPRGYFK